VTALELKDKLDKEFPIGEHWPKTYEVDSETYFNVLQHILRYRIQNDNFVFIGPFKTVELILGPANGIMFKGVELLIRD
jgi:hypothetical protein